MLRFFIVVVINLVGMYIGVGCGSVFICLVSCYNGFFFFFIKEVFLNLILFGFIMWMCYLIFVNKEDLMVVVLF